MMPGMAVARLRGQRRLPERAFAGDHPISMPRIAIPELELDLRYLARFDAEALLDGEFLLINERRKVDLYTWNAPEASHLWNFNLHYFEWGVALAVRWRKMGDRRYLDCYKGFVRSWIRACPYAEGDAWHPYTVSLRLVNWLIAADLFDSTLQEDAGFFAEMRESMYRQYRHLLANQETHLRANHWWENLKTLVIMSAAFGERNAYAKAMRRLEGQLDEQILPDGVHFERSLMYHKLVLEGMLRIYAASDQSDFALPANLMPKVKSMLDAMTSLERGMGKTPFFNDSADGVAKECAPLAAACARLLGMEADDAKTAFPDAGYYKLYDGDVAVMFDAGEPGPSYMLGHAHCDCLSFELSYKSEPVIVNSGTYAYQSELRPYFRSTAAHNTCVVDSEEQLECWGEHRVGKGYGEVKIELASDKRLSASMSLPSGRRLFRTIALANGARVIVEDQVRQMEGTTLESFVHVAPRAFTGLVSASGSVAETESDYSPEFNLIEKARALSIKGSRKVSCTLRIADKEGGDHLAV